MKSESAELVSGLIRQYRRLRLLYLGYLAAAVLALVFFFVDKRVTLALVAASLVYHLVVVRRAGKAYQRAFVHACGQCTLARRLQDARHTEAPTLEEGELRRARLVAANDAKGSVLVREGGSGTYHGRRVRLGDGGAGEGHRAGLAAHPRAGDDEAVPGRHAAPGERAAAGGGLRPRLDGGRHLVCPPAGGQTRRAR